MYCPVCDHTLEDLFVQVTPRSEHFHHTNPCLFSENGLSEPKRALLGAVEVL